VAQEEVREEAAARDILLTPRRGAAAPPALAALGIGALLGAVGLTTWELGGPATGFAATPTVSAPPASGAAVPARLSQEPDRGVKGVRSVVEPQARDYAGWAAAMASRTGVPARALEAYAAASERLGEESPGCHLDWTTLAGIGYVESRNGDAGGGLRPTGEPREAIFGVALDGIRGAVDQGKAEPSRLDGQPGVDRAIGPLQFLPSTWRVWGTDADGDGEGDPQDIDDAALAAGRYLCASGDLGTAQAWTAAVFSYNHSAKYVRSVYDVAEQIATASEA
jgi:hypothetical protein